MTKTTKRCLLARALLCAALLGVPTALHAQTLRGRILDQEREGPISDAVVRLLDHDGKERAQVLADSVGRFTLTPPGEGQYYLQVERLGYLTTRSPLLALKAGDIGVASLDLMMQPEPLGLEGLKVSVENEAKEYLGMMGLSPPTLGNRWIGPDRVAAIPIKRDPGSIIEWAQVPGTRVIRPENTSPGSGDMGLCVAMIRARTGGGLGQCALIVVDGVTMPPQAAINIDPETIEAMAVLVPREATTFYGEMGSAGVVYIWTRRGGMRR